MSKVLLNINLDDLLLDIATTIELSDADRKIIDKRYHDLKAHLERPSSPLAKYLRDNESRIYPQGSVSISATIISGDKDDRFDVDAMVEFDVPPTWADKDPLNILYEALQGFPGAQNIERNTRCVTISFAFMHMDVTIMHPEQEPRPERIGEIFHSPDSGDSYRVPANPFGFAHWFRGSVHFKEGGDTFPDLVSSRRLENFVNRLDEANPRAADQDDLPPMIPPRFDAQQVVALKIMKRFLNMQYRNRNVKKPPSIYITKMASDCGFEPLGLTAQLERLALYIRDQIAEAVLLRSGPDERNPAYQLDRINDRWPSSQDDRQTLVSVINIFLQLLEAAKNGSFTEIMRLMDEGFGEKISEHAIKKHLDRRSNLNSAEIVKTIGTVVPPTILTTPEVANRTRVIPGHHFHCEEPDDSEESD